MNYGVKQFSSAGRVVADTVTSWYKRPADFKQASIAEEIW